MAHQMNGREAIQKDKADGFYAEFDEEHSDWGVFGLNTGFCYLLSDEQSCKDKADEMNKKYND